MTRRFPLVLRSLCVLFALFVLFALGGCGNDVTSVPITDDEYVVFAWNDLGMHCLNPTYDQAVILPPYNTIWAQVVRRGAPPQIITDGLTVSYRLLDNTYSYGKTDDRGGNFAQFWDQVQTLFGTTLEHDRGLNLADPQLHNGLAGDMVAAAGHFEVHGIPVVPVSDAGVWNPYQVAEITVKDSEGNTLVVTQATVPTSDEINCAKCHAQGGVATENLGGGTANVFQNILAVHDLENGDEYSPSLVDRAPVLCASCHASPALGTPSPNEPDMYLSAVIHGSHAGRGTACFDCHPGEDTACNRSLAHTAADGNCTTCHGSMSQVAGSIEDGGRVPWISEPTCDKSGCHVSAQGVATGGALYRNATGHGGMYCAACHGSPHAMVPSREASDNHQALQYQNRAVSMGSCAACHGSSHGEGSSEFGEVHGGGGHRSACNVCHTSVGTNTAQWPHAFTWKAR
jgi:hypothetical protein